MTRPAIRNSSRLLWLMVVIGTLSCCAYDPTRETSPLELNPTWGSGHDAWAPEMSGELVRRLDEAGVRTGLWITGDLYLLESPLDENGAGRVDSLIRMHRGRTAQAERVRHLNKLVYDPKEYRFLRLSVAFWRDVQGAPARPGLALMSRKDAMTARRGGDRFRFLGAEPAMTWKAIQPIPSDREILEDFGADGKKEQLVGRLQLKQTGVLPYWTEANQGTGISIAFEVPDEVVRTILDEEGAVCAEVTLDQHFRAGEEARDAVPLRGTLAIRNPTLDGHPVLAPQVAGQDRLYADRIDRSQLRALIETRRTVLRRLDSLVTDDVPDDQQQPAWQQGLATLHGLQRELATCILEVWPRELATLLPALEEVTESVAGKVLPSGEAVIMNTPQGPLTVRTGDVALRLGSSRQIAVGTFPLPAVRERQDGLVTAMDVPAAGNTFGIFRMFFSQPEAQPLVKALLTPVWSQVSAAIRTAIETPRAAELHPFVTDPAATPVFFTALDAYIQNQIREETVATEVDDSWETQPIAGESPTVEAPGETPGELVWFTPEDVEAMRGRDTGDVQAAIAAREAVASLAGLRSPYELDMNNEEELNRDVCYWPGTPFLSHAGMIIVEEIEVEGGTRRQAFVYDAYPGEGIMRKSLHHFFGVPEAAAGAIFRMKDDTSAVPGLAAQEVVKLYHQRWRQKRDRFGKPDSADPGTEVLLAGDEAAPPTTRAQAWDSFDYAFDWRNQTRYSCSELVWSHYARNGVNLADSFSMLLAPVQVAQDQLGWGVEVMIQASPQALILSDKLWRVADFDSAAMDEALTSYSDTGATATVPASRMTGKIAEPDRMGPTLTVYSPPPPPRP